MLALSDATLQGPVGAGAFSRLMDAARAPIERLAGPSQVVRVMVPIRALKLLDAHAKEARGLPQISTALHQPSRRGVAKGMWRDIGHDAVVRIAAESLIHVVNRHSVPFDAEPLPKALPSPYMR